MAGSDAEALARLAPLQDGPLARRALGHVQDRTSVLEENRAVARGARPVMPPGPSPEPGVRMAFVADLEGNLIELLHRPTQVRPGEAAR